MITVHREVVYARVPGYRPLALDLYVPEKPAALCLYLHGGGWRAGSRTIGPGSFPSFFEHVAESGLAVASIDYRLSGEARFPAQLDDVRAAADFLAGYGIATERTVAWGVSAGGHLAALAGLGGGFEAVVCWYAPTDLGALAADGVTDRSREIALVGGDSRELMDAASPVHHVHAGAPPFLLVHGDADTAVPFQQSRRLAAALTQHGVTAIVEPVPGGTHMLPELDTTATATLIKQSVGFLLDVTEPMIC
ncbi:acetyl esterase/lipase [Actinoplanes lutulentus]|uniref:Acetyl esterase/lipase n=1 Tax=Actinoplanes lutulentus TaxID=1287878 RepID=A0A327YVN4_9ACTN|nr:alpha/beta hydrolase [Actinoplanes lutulentus]MBB2947130.1 acetyl esterase/lipase [Actinoplanes lutulentus]RAK24664.1 acetyl esterase/lipase [Actinoplanes lutulentus]